jgi:membrane protein implicated in regulation of membrane protease activity
MIKRYNRISFLWGVPGFALQVAGVLMHRPWLSWIGIGLLAVGLMYYARAKRRHPAWGLFGLLSIVGLLVLACLSDRGKEEQPKPGDPESDPVTAEPPPGSEETV